MQSGRILKALAYFERTHGSDLWWFKKFREWISRAGQADKLSHEVALALRRSG